MRRRGRRLHDPECASLRPPRKRDLPNTCDCKARQRARLRVELGGRDQGEFLAGCTAIGQPGSGNYIRRLIRSPGD